MNAEYLRGLLDAKAIADKHVAMARKNVSECRPWSPPQAEWSRARDLGQDISEEIDALTTETRQL